MISTRLCVKRLLRERRWTTKVLAEKTGLSESYLTHIKNGTRRWNEDALKKLAAAFELMPSDLFEVQKPVNSTLQESLNLPSDLLAQTKDLNLNLKIVPVLGQIPSQPSEHNNLAAQVSTGHQGQFVPVLGNFDDNAMFCLEVNDNSLSPHFAKGDHLIISPTMWTNSGDIVAVEYGNDNPVRAIMQINFMEEFVALESLNHKKAPIVLMRGKDQFRIIGKVVFRYQKMA